MSKIIGRNLLYILSVLLFLTSCNKSNQLQDEWYSLTKDEIIKQSEQKHDRIEVEFNQDSTYKTETYYSKNQKFRKKGINEEFLRLDIRYSRDGRFELRREICDDGNWAFEGIYYVNGFYGLSTWKHCNGQIDKQGIRYNTKNVGIWKEWDENGKLLKETDYKNLPKISSMPKINK